MLSAKFLVVSFLYLLHVTRFVVADPRGGDQFCESVRTVTVLHTVTPNQPPPSSSPAKNPNLPSPTVTQQPGNVNLGGNNDKNPKSSSVNKNGNSKPSSVNNKNNNTKTSSTVLPTATPPVKTSNDQNNGDPSTSLTLDPSVIQTIDGTAQGDGQMDSLVSTNNFINFCIGKTLSNGIQVQAGSCNPTPMGDIPSVDNMPSAKFNSPKNFDTIPANTPFDIALQVNNLNTGTFVDPAKDYFAAPQQLVGGVIKGHSHVTVQLMTSLDSTDPLDPKVFAFFKGLNEPANNNVLTTTVTNGLPPGVYRISSVNAAANHQEVVGPIAQRGSFNDAVYITVTDDGQNSPPSSTPADPASSTVLPTSISSSILGSSVSSVSLPVSTNSIPSDVSSTSSLPLPTGTDGNNDGSSSEPPVPSSTGGENRDNQGDPTSSITLPATPTPTPGDQDPQGGNGPNSNSKRMHRRSRLA